MWLQVSALGIYKNHFIVAGPERRTSLLLAKLCVSAVFSGMLTALTFTEFCTAACTLAVCTRQSMDGSTRLRGAIDPRRGISDSSENFLRLD